MKALLIAIVSLTAAPALADTVSCHFGDMDLTLEIRNQKIVKAEWWNQDWGMYDHHLVDVQGVTYQVTAQGAEATVRGDYVPDANATYACW